ncbi:MAG: hypothetical protein MJY61_04255 [Bacteroidales bacterium]|nr:hypothetical protein [Bacteroidales bacterium]
MKRILTVSLCIAALCSCSSSARLEQLDRNGVRAQVTLPPDTPLRDVEKPVYKAKGASVLDTDGREVLIMNAVMGDDGQMVATDEINAAVKIETFRNVAERGGLVDIKFKISAPAALADSRWQIQFTPELLMENDTVYLDKVFLTGEQYRRMQRKEYEKYRRYLNSLKYGPDDFLNEREYRIFLFRERGAESGWRDAAREHYTDRFLRGINERRIARKDEMFSRLVRHPILSEGLRLDTVTVAGNGDVEYEYVQSLRLDYSVRKFNLLLKGRLRGVDDFETELPDCGPLTYYVSSLSTLTEEMPEHCEDSLYLRALELLRRREYRQALPILVPYADFNAALAYAALNYNDKALEILELLDNVPKVEYLKALSYCRTHQDIKALKCYDNACAADASYVFRGNLDPEIRKLKNRYNLTR